MTKVTLMPGGIGKSPTKGEPTSKTSRNENSIDLVPTVTELMTDPTLATKGSTEGLDELMACSLHWG